MKLLNTNVLVYSRQPSSPFHQWAVDQIAEAVADQGAGFSAVSLAELCAANPASTRLPLRGRH